MKASDLGTSFKGYSYPEFSCMDKQRAAKMSAELLGKTVGALRSFQSHQSRQVRCGLHGSAIGTGGGAQDL